MSGNRRSLPPGKPLSAVVKQRDSVVAGIGCKPGVVRSAVMAHAVAAAGTVVAVLRCHTEMFSMRTILHGPHLVILMPPMLSSEGPLCVLLHPDAARFIHDAGIARRWHGEHENQGQGNSALLHSQSVSLALKSCKC